MKIKFLLALMVAGSLGASAQSQGYKDGIEYYKAGEYDDAKIILDKTLNDAGTDKSLANYYLGQIALSKGDKAAAKNYFDAGVSINPENPYNYVGLGNLELMSGQADAASDNFKKAQGLDKKNYEVLVDIARAYYKADPVKYAKEIEKYLAKAHKDSKHKEPSIYILEGDMLFDKQDWGGAAAKYEMATGYDKANPEGYVKYARTNFKVNPKFSIDKLREFLQVAPSSALGQRELAENLYEANYWKQAAEQYGSYIQNPNHFPKDKERYAVLLYWAENYPASLKVADEVLAQNPSSFLMQRLRMLNNEAMQNYPAAAQAGEAFFRSNPNGYFTANDYTTYASALSETGNDSLALVQYEVAAEKFPENGDLLKNLSSAYSNIKDYPKAADAYGKYIATLAEPSANDYFALSGRYLNVAATAGDNQELRADAAKKGIEAVDNAIAKAEPNPVLLQRKARLQIASNKNMPDSAAIATYGEMTAMLDQDPANADAANENNNLDLYREAYLFSVKYYNEVDVDKEKAAEFSAKLKEVSDKLAQ